MISIQNRRIYNNGQLLHPIGWTYQNIPIGQGVGRSFAKEPLQIPFDLSDYVDAGANCTRLYYDQYNESEYQVALDLFEEYGIDVIMFYYVPHNTDYSLATGLANRTSVISSVETMITNLSGFDTIIGWGIGNEVNYELGGTPINDWFSLLNQSIAAGKAIDSTRFYTTANGDVSSIITSGQFYCPNIDVWGANVYRGTSFTNLITSILNIPNRPFLVTEFGFDAYDSVNIGGEDQAGQATRNIALIEELESYYPYISGYLAFQWSDGWFKMGNNSTHDTTGNASSNDDRDQIIQEEWFGATESLSSGSATSRTKRTTFQTNKEYWTSLVEKYNYIKRLPVR